MRQLITRKQAGRWPSGLGVFHRCNRERTTAYGVFSAGFSAGLASLASFAGAAAGFSSPPQPMTREVLRATAQARTTRIRFFIDVLSGKVRGGIPNPGEK